MVLSLGTKLGSHEVLLLLGTGGMGEVYRAHDTKLGRDVALKVLPEALAQDAALMARFQREAQLLASLNHPNIATIHGLEESGGTCALVMELVEGPTLAERVCGSEDNGEARGPRLQLDESLHIAKQIAEGLEYAHERGIIHRDLKPANIKVRPDGAVKILDFGLAKALEDSPTVGSINTSPTISAMATHAGIILGTAAYMSPEQARGKTVDRRSDIWSFGAMLFEMLSGKRAFAGEDVSHTLAAVIMGEPDWKSLPSHFPAEVISLLRRSLTKDPKQRLQAIGEARIVIAGLIAHPQTPQDETASQVAVLGPRPPWRRALQWGIAAVLAVALLGTWLGIALRPAARPAAPLRLSVELGSDVSLDATLAAAAALSPDGNTLAFGARPHKAGSPEGERGGNDMSGVLVTPRPSTGSPTQLFVRRLDRAEAAPLAGTENAYAPFFSPDGQWIGFFAGGELEKVSVAGGAVLTLCDAPTGRGGDWGEDGNIVFAPTLHSGLFRVSDMGGTPTELTKIDSSTGERSHRWPQLLPGGKAVLFTDSHGGNFNDANIAVQSLGTGQRKIVQRGGTYGRYLPGGYLVFLHNGTLFAAPFDLDRLETTRAPVPAIEGVKSEPVHGSAQFSFSSTGTLLYLPGQSTVSESAIFWITPDGKRTPLLNARGQYGELRLSPDGRRLAMAGLDTNGDVGIWVYEQQRDTTSRFTFGNRYNARPVSTPDGQRLAFASDRTKRGVENIYWQRADGTGEVQRLTEGDNPQVPTSWHPTGKFLAFTETNPQTAFDIMILPMEGSHTAGWKPGKPFAFLNGPNNEIQPMFSPDGRWIAYVSDESGRFEVYVRPFPGPGGRWQISTNGGLWPSWSPKGKELFYEEVSSSRIMVAAYAASGGGLQPEKPRPWTSNSVPFLQGSGRPLDVSPDGKRLAVLLTAADQTQAPSREDHLTFVLNFTDELRRIAPAKKGKQAPIFR